MSHTGERHLTQCAPVLTSQAVLSASECELAKALAALLEVTVVVEARSRRREQYHGPWPSDLTGEAHRIAHARSLDRARLGHARRARGGEQARAGRRHPDDGRVALGHRPAELRGVLAPILAAADEHHLTAAEAGQRGKRRLG